MRVLPSLCALLLLVVISACQEPAKVGGVRVSSEVLFNDDFAEGSTAPWLLEADKVSQAVVTNGHLMLNIDAPGTVHFVTLAEPTFSDFVVEVDITQLAGNPGSSYGLLLRMSGAQQFYRFDITGNGEFIVERHDGQGSWIRLTEDWQTSEALNQGLNATNHLAINATGSRLSFYANHQLLAEITDQTYQQGLIALDAGTFNQTSLQVAFDNVVVRQP